MLKKLFLTLFSLLPVACLFSCSSKDNISGLSIKVNEYASYGEMVVAESCFFEKYSDEAKYTFELDTKCIDIKSVKYFIGGVCYCPLENKNESCGHESASNCECLRNRELFVEYGFNDGNVVTLIYKNCPSNKTNTYNWVKSNGGNCYRYESNFNEDFSYILEDSNRNNLCGMKMLFEDEKLKSSFFEIIVSSIY